MKRDQSRRTEGSLLLFASLILVVGALLVYSAKTYRGLPSDAIDLNRASEDELAVAFDLDPALAGALVEQRKRLGGFESVGQAARVTVFPSRDAALDAAQRLPRIADVNAATPRELHEALGVPRAMAERIAVYRASLPGGRFARPLDLLRTPILDTSIVAGLGPRLYVRTTAAVLAGFAVIVAVTLLIFFASAVLIRRGGLAARAGGGGGLGGDAYFIPISLLLGGLGVLLLFSARDPLRDAPLYAHHAQGLWLGCAALVAGALMSPRTRGNLRHYTYLWAFAAFALVLALLLFGRGPGGVRINLGFFQPIEAVKLLLVLFVAGYLTARGDLLAEALHRWRPPLPKGLAARIGIPVPKWQDVGPMLAMFLGGLLLFLVVREMGPALLIFAAFVTTLYVATGRGSIAWLGAAMAILGALAAYWLHVGVFAQRADMWMSPWNNTHRQGMQLGQALWGISSGGEEGSGLGLGALAQPGALPVVESDLIFAGAAEELGLIGALAILTLYAALIWRGMRATLAARTDFDRVLAAGLTALFAWQVFIIVAGVTGIIPLTGITLPFMARGNTSLVADFLLLGLLRGISSPSASQPEGEPKPLWRRTARQFAIAAASALLAVVGLRLFWLQAAMADTTAGRTIRTPDADGVARAKVNPRLIAIERAIPRGSIYDRKGRVLATSRLDEITAAMDSPTAQDAGDARQSDPRTARRLYQRRGRYYPLGPAAAHLVGYLDPALGGPVGIEKEYDGDLRGFHNYSDLLADYRNKDLPAFRSRPRRGSDVQLTIDADLQEAAYRTLQQRVTVLAVTHPHHPGPYGAAMVVLDPGTGEALASVSLPAFDPNRLTPDTFAVLEADRNRSHALLDRARYGYYPPGSTLKVATAAAGLEAGLDPSFVCEHTLRNVRWSYRGKVYARRAISDDVHDRAGHGSIRMARALQVSCNLYYANLGLQLGTDRLQAAFAAPDRWNLSHVPALSRFAADLPLNAIGQGGMVASCTEMARIAAAIADRGEMMQPRYVKDVHEARSNSATPASLSLEPRVSGHPVSAENAARLADMMQGVVREGTAAGIFDGLPVVVAGKTGTAQTDQGDRLPHSWFIGFAPYAKPDYAVACVIENGGYGKQGAAPVVRDFLANVYRR